MASIRFPLGWRPRPRFFRAFVENFPAEDSPIGDFIVGAKADKSFPDARTWSELKSYLHWRGATDDQVVAGRLVWRRYLNDKKNSGSAGAPMFVEGNDR